MHNMNELVGMNVGVGMKGGIGGKSREWRDSLWEDGWFRIGSVVRRRGNRNHGI